MGNQLPSPKTGGATQFSAHVRCGQTAGWIKLKLGMQVSLGPGHIVLDGDPSPCPQRGTAPPPIFVPYLLRPNAWMDQDATWYMQVGLGPGDFVLDGDPATSLKRGRPNFRPMPIVAIGQTVGWIKMALGMEVGLGPGYIVLDGDPAPSSSLQKGEGRAFNYRLMSVVAKRLDGSR